MGTKIRKRFPFMTAALAGLAISAFAQEGKQSLAWPPPPQQARIRHVRTIASAADIGHSEGFFSHVLRWVFGGEEETLPWLVHPVSVAVSPSGKIHVSDPGLHSIHVIDLAEKSYTTITRTDTGPLRSPVGMAFAPDGCLYVSDSERDEVIIYNADGRPTGHFALEGVRPTGIAIAGRLLYAADTRNHCIRTYDLHGRPAGVYGRRGTDTVQFNYPISLAVDSNLFIVDAMNFRIQELDTAGRFITSFGRVGNAPGSFASPKGICKDSDGNVYVTDALLDNVQIFDPQGRLLLVFGSNGSGNGEFQKPSGIAVDRNDTVYVVDALNKRLQLFSYLK